MFEPTIPAFERGKTVHALGLAATVIGTLNAYVIKTELFSELCEALLRVYHKLKKITRVYSLMALKLYLVCVIKIFEMGLHLYRRYARNTSTYIYTVANTVFNQTVGLILYV
jgi:hypothetical protein